MVYDVNHGKIETPFLTLSPTQRRGGDLDLTQKINNLMNMTTGPGHLCYDQERQADRLSCKLAWHHLRTVGSAWLHVAAIPLHRQVQQVCTYSFEKQWAADLAARPIWCKNCGTNRPEACSTQVCNPAQL